MIPQRGTVAADSSSLQRTLLVAAILGFLLIGIGAIGCVCFGIAEIVQKDSIFLNDGLGEVLTVLGVYFTVPYLFCVGAFVVIVVKPQCFSKILPSTEMSIFFVVTVLMFLLQQAFTDVYLAILTTKTALIIVFFDAAVLVAYLYFKFEKPYATMAYTVLYAIKMAIQWDSAYLTANESVFGPNGVCVMLFLCIPLVQFPLYMMGTSTSPVVVVQRSDNAIEGQSGGPNIVESFTMNFNLFLSHLLHSLDLISIYNFAFVLPESTVNYAAAPRPFKILIILLIFVAFLGNNLSVLHLFYRRDNVEDAEIIFLPRKLREVSRLVDNTEEGGSQRRRIFQYMLCMLVVCDVPMLITRIELWRQQYAPLNIFVAKNIKSIADVIIMVMRADHSSERQQPKGHRYSLLPADSSATHSQDHR